MDSPAAGRLRTAWDHELRGLPGRFSIDLSSLDGPVVSRDAAAEHYAASTIKLAVLGALLRKLSAGTPAEVGTLVQPRFPSAAGGSFALAQGDDQDDQTWAQLGQEVALTTLAERMIVASGNLATNLILERIGLAAVQTYLAGIGLGGQVRLGRLIGDAAAETLGFTNTVTAGGLASLLLGFAQATALPAPEAATAMAMLTRQRHLRLIPAGLPAGTWCASKGGWVPGVKHDVALVRPDDAPAYVLAICTTSRLAERPGEELVARLSAITWDHWTR